MSTHNSMRITSINSITQIQDDDKRAQLVASHIKAGKAYKNTIKTDEENLMHVEAKLVELSLTLPNFIHADIPIGPYEKAKIIYEYNTTSIAHSNNADHVKICKALDLTNFEDAGKVTGERFVYLKNEAVLLELALTNWAMEYLVGKQFTPIITPDIVKSQIIDATGFNPRDDSCISIISSNL